MSLLFTMIVPLTICGVALYGAARRVDVYGALAQGAAEQGQPGQQEQPQRQPRGGGPGHGAHSSSLTRRSR